MSRADWDERQRRRDRVTGDFERTLDNQSSLVRLPGDAGGGGYNPIGAN